MTLPLNRRSYDIFLSHSHSDAAFASSLYNWLTEVAGFKVWIDKAQLGAGSSLATDIQTAIENCKSAVLIVSAESMSKGWVHNEYNSAIDERARNQDFRVIVVKIGNANTKDLIKGITWVEVEQAEISLDLTYGLVRGLYPFERQLLSEKTKDIYVSCSWRTSDAFTVKEVCTHFISSGFRLIGDSKDQVSFSSDQDRVRQLIGSCGGLVAIIPFRGAREISAPDYKYFLKEIEIAKSYEMPIVAFIDEKIQWLESDALITKCTINSENLDGNLVADCADRLWEEWVVPPAPHFIFCALDLELDTSKPNSMYRIILESIAGVPTIVGSEVQASSLHESIAKKIQDALLVIADITDNNVNSCIEAGMGIMAKKNVRLISSGKSRSPPFMLRGAGQLLGYNSEADLIGVAHKIARPFRRRIINTELS